MLPPAQAAVARSASDAALPEGAQICAAPLLSFVRFADRELLAVGNARVVLCGDGGDVRVELHVIRLWRADVVADDPRRWHAADNDSGLTSGLAADLDRISHSLPASGLSAAVGLAKALAEHARGQVAALRDRRYELERRLGRHLRREADVGGLELLLADVVELSIAAGRARDEARAAVREGMWLWRNDSAAYHAHRRVLDPTLVRRRGATAARRRPWFAQYDAGVRQCIALERQAGEESDALHRLLAAGSTIAVARDAAAQETFNLVAAVGAVALGLPALVLALYSTGDLLPIREPGRFIVFLPLAIAGVLSAVLAFFLPGDLSRWRRLCFALFAVVVTLAVLAVAGVLVDPVP